jgi:hypothetical protein
LFLRYSIFYLRIIRQLDSNNIIGLATAKDLSGKIAHNTTTPETGTRPEEEKKTSVNNVQRSTRRYTFMTFSVERQSDEAERAKLS